MNPPGPRRGLPGIKYEYWDYSFLPYYVFPVFETCLRELLHTILVSLCPPGPLPCQKATTKALIGQTSAKAAMIIGPGSGSSTQPARLGMNTELTNQITLEKGFVMVVPILTLIL